MFFKKLIKKILGKLLIYLLEDRLLLETIETKLNELKIKRCLKQVTLAQNSKFYEQAMVHNMQNKVENITIGTNTHIRGFLQLFGQGGKIRIGNYCYIGEGTRIWSAEEIIIGNEVLIAHDVNIHDNISHPISSQKRHQDYKRILGLENFDIALFDIRPKPIHIKNKAWIGFNCIILKGVTIGEGAIVGAGSVVTKDVPDWTIVAGNPAKIIRTIPESER